MVTQTQLARIQAPLINDATYVEDLNNAFEVINENFKKLSSMPFLQGVQGDSYQVITKNVWDTSGAIWIITEDGALLLNSIFGISTISAGDSFDKCKNLVGNTYEGFSPLDFYGTGRGTEITNNILYFQTIIDDSGNENEQNRIIGQYYYFIDGRLKQLGNLRESGILNSSFEDFSGFYRYTYNDAEHTKLYEKVDMLPTIYYDAERNDICWKFFGQRTGISAIGAPGEDGKNASFSFVKVDVNSDTPSSQVTGVADFDHDNTEASQLWVAPSDDNLKEGFSFIFIYRSNYPLRYAFGEVRGSGSTWMAYWDNQSVLQDFSTLVTMNDFFDKVGFNYPNGSRKSIEIHAAGTGTSSNTHRHTIGTVFNGDINEYNNNTNGAGNLLFRRKLDTDGGRAPDGKSVVFDNYTVKVQKYGDSSNSGTGKPTNEKYTEIKNTGVYIYPSRDVAFKTKIEGDAAIFGGSVEVKSSLNISGKVVSNLIFENPNNSGNTVKRISIEEKSGTNRHLDIHTDGLYLFAGDYESRRKGEAALNVDGSIYTKSGGNIVASGSFYGNNIDLQNGIALKDHITFYNVGNRYWHHINVVGEGNTSGANQSHLALQSKLLSLFDNNGQNLSSKADLKVYGNIFGSLTLNPWGTGGFYTERNPGTQETGVEKVREIYRSGIISGTDRNIGWYVNSNVPDGTLIICTGGNVGAWNQGNTHKSNKNRKQNYCSISNGWKAFGGGLYIVLTADNGRKTLYLVASNYAGQQFIG